MESKTKAIWIAIIIAIMSISIGVNIYINLGNKQTHEVIVTDKQIKRYDNEDVYLVFVEDINGNPSVFKNQDTMVYGKLNSSDVQAKLKIDHTYKITTVGHRNPFLSTYPNIIEVEEIEQ